MRNATAIRYRQTLFIYEGTNLKIRFMSSNQHKIAEVQRILVPEASTSLRCRRRSRSLQTEDVHALVGRMLIRPLDPSAALCSSSTGLYLKRTQWTACGLTWPPNLLGPVEEDRFASLVAGAGRCLGRSPQRPCSAIATDTRCICSKALSKGRCRKRPAGPTNFQWDCVFIPNGFSETFAEMGPAKDSGISMRRIALDKFADHLNTAEGHEMKAELLEAHRKGRLMLFVGAGVSANIGLSGLERSDRTHCRRAGIRSQRFSPPMARPWRSQSSTKKKMGGLGALCSWMDRAWHNTGTDISKSDIQALA